MIYVLDVETTGLDPKVDRVVELAVASVDPTSSAVVPIYEGFVDPGIPIPAEASAVHHITDDMVSGYPTFTNEVPPLLARIDPTLLADPKTSGAIFVAHNAPFDRDFLDGLIPADRWIDTCRIAKHFYPDAPGYSNQVLRYWLGLKIDITNPHRAMDDVRVTAKLFLHELTGDGLGGESIDRMLELSQTPVLLKTVTFGKHKGDLWRDVDRGYLSWASRQEWDDSDIAWTVKQAMAGRYR